MTQNEFLEEVGQSTVFLINGVKLQGTVSVDDNDDEVIYISRDGETQIVYKHAIATVAPCQVS